MEKTEILKNSKRHCFFMGVDDSGAQLCKANMVYGMAKIHCLQRELGFESNATFISTPNMTITRNASLWKSGFGYGGKISWGDGDRELVILDIRSNGCGMLVGGLTALPEIETMIRRMYEMDKKDTDLDGIKLIWNFHKSNHFIDVYEIKPVEKAALDLPPYGFIMHASSDEFKGDNEMGFGLYLDNSNKLKEMAERINTPFGGLHFLTGSNATAFYERYKYVDEFTRRKRRMAAGLLFGEFKEISNQTHQGLISMNEMVLGCHHINREDTLFPIALRADLPAYLVKGIPNISPDNIEILGFAKRARKLGLYKRLRKANVIPHGGGFVFPDVLMVNKVTELNGNRYFEVEMLNDRGKKVISEMQDLPYDYRGRKVVLRAMEIGTIEIVAKLIPKYALKI